MKKLLSPKIVIPLTVLLLLLGSVGYILLAPATWWKPFYVKMELDGNTPQAQAASLPAEPGTTPVELSAPGENSGSLQQTPGIMYELDNKVVNLAEPGGLRYLQAAVVLELRPIDESYYTLEGEARDQAKEHFLEQIDARRPIIDDILTTTLSSKTFNDVASVDGKKELKEELMTAINDALGYDGVINVYLTNFVVQ